MIETAAGAEVTGKVTEIREEKPGTDTFAAIVAPLLGEIPEVPVYAVLITPDATDQILTPGEKLTVRVITETAENAVAVHIRHIREKIEIDPAEPRYLKVVWGKGYKIQA